MAYSKAVQFLALLPLSVLFAWSSTYARVSDECLTCICMATSECNKTFGCLGDICGPYWITEPYWNDAKRPTIPRDEPHRKGAFERCVTDPICAGETIRNYMDIFGQDCNDDGKISCLDYARIHRFGGYGCHSSLDPKFKAKFDPCLKEIGEAERSVDITANQQEIEIF